jgi:peptide/nickel transport system permease protein
MKRYLLYRLALLLPTLFGVLTLVFLFIHLTPGDPVDIMLGETASAADRQELRQILGLNQPLAQQYRSFLINFLRGDLGQSLYEGRPVAAMVTERYPATLELALCAMSAALLISFPLAIWSAVRRGRWTDRATLMFSLLGLSMPNFWLGPFVMIIFSIQLGWLPVSGRGGPDHLVLPALTLGLGMTALLIRILRTNLLRVMGEDYVQTARAKGLSERSVWLKHTLRNALLSLVTIASLQFGGLLAGSLITETIFSWPGIGRLTMQAIEMRDYPLVQGCVLMISLSYVFLNFITDLIYQWVDPRITYGN